MLFTNKKKCTEETIGTIRKVKFNGENHFVYVEYTVGETEYTICEQITYIVSKKYKLGKLSIGRHCVSAINDTRVGANIRVLYNPNRPHKGFLPDNNGRHI